MLGLSCYHMRNMMADMGPQTELWTEAWHGRPDWDAILGGYDSVIDFPGSRFWRELSEHYPDAKVLLSVRDGESWARSMMDTIWEIFNGNSLMAELSRARCLIDDDWRRWLDVMRGMGWQFDGPFVGAQAGREALVAANDRWNDEVKATIPAERLLVWHPKDGWEPLCEFLEVDVPGEPVPNVNDTAAFVRGIEGMCLGALNEWWAAQEDGPGLHGAANATR